MTEPGIDTISRVTSPLIILGCGYIGSRLARAALAAGRPVRVCARSTGRLAPLGELGAQVKYVDAAMVKQLGPAMASMDGATVVYSIPPVTALPPGHAMRAALQAAAGGGVGCFIHLSSSGLYGDHPDDDTWIDEDTPTAHDDRAMAGVTTDEAAIALAHSLLDAARSGVSSSLLPLIDQGAPVDLRDSSGNSPLMLAAYHGHAELVGELVARGADVDLANDRGQSPLAGAAFKGFTEVARVLLEAGADPDLGTPSALETAKYFERAEIVSLIESRRR